MSENNSLKKNVLDEFVVEVVNIKNYKEKVIYVGRGSVLGNPFYHQFSKYNIVKVTNRQEAILKYKEWILDKIKYNTPQRWAINECVQKLISTKKIILGCFCKPQCCHADFLAEIILKEAYESAKKLKEFFSDD